MTLTPSEKEKIAAFLGSIPEMQPGNTYGWRCEACGDMAFGIRTSLNIIGYRSMALCTTCNLTIKS